MKKAKLNIGPEMILMAPAVQEDLAATVVIKDDSPKEMTKVNSGETDKVKKQPPAKMGLFLNLIKKKNIAFSPVCIVYISFVIIK